MEKYVTENNTPVEKRPLIVASDLEGVLVPEIWVAVAEKTGIEKLQLTTRDVPDYDELMQMRLSILDEAGLTMSDIQEVIGSIAPLPGAAEFVSWVRRRAQFIIISDTFYEFAAPLMAQLDYPTIFCHSLEVDSSDRIVDYRLRLAEPKRNAIHAFRRLKFRTLAMGDSYNDIAMLNAADVGVLFDPPQNVIDDNPRLPVVRSYAETQQFIRELLSRPTTAAIPEKE